MFCTGKFQVDDATFRHAQRGDVSGLRAGLSTELQHHSQYAAFGPKYGLWLALLLRVAAVNDWPDAVRYILEFAETATFDIVNFRGTRPCYMRPLEYAASVGSTRSIAVLLAAKAETSVWYDTGTSRSPLISAASMSQPGAVRMLLGAGVSVHVSASTLWNAVELPGNVLIVRAFLAPSLRMSLILTDDFKAQLMTVAAKVRGNAATVHALLQARASPNYRECPLRAAAGLSSHTSIYPIEPHLDTMRVLLRARADLGSPMHTQLFVDASGHALIEPVRLLLDAGLNVNAYSWFSGSRDMTALHAATGHAAGAAGVGRGPCTEEDTATRVALMQLLIERKANLEAVDSRNMTPLALALSGEYCDRLKFDRQYSEAIAAFNEKHRAAVIQCLLSAKACVNSCASNHD